MRTLAARAISWLAIFSIGATLAACGGGSSGGSTGTLPSSTPTPTAQPTGTGTLAKTSFVIKVGSSSSAGHQRPAYVPASVQSITIALNTVNGGAPPAGLTLSVTSNLTACTSGCTVAGPSVPPGSDSFTLTTFDAASGAGNQISSATQTFTISAGVNNNNLITLLGIPHSLSITGVPSGTAGTAFASPATLTVTVKDADGNAITGTYATPVTFSDTDTSSLTQGTALQVNGGSAATGVTINSSSDVVAFNYGGLAIASATLKASASGATSQSVAFTPALSPIVYSGPLVGSTPEIDLYAASGTGSSGAFTATETGLTNSPYNKTLTASAAGACSTIGSVSPNTGTSFTATIAPSPSVGNCAVTISDGLGQSKNVTLTYTTSSFGVQ